MNKVQEMQVVQEVVQVHTMEVHILEVQVLQIKVLLEVQ